MAIKRRRLLGVEEPDGVVYEYLSDDADGLVLVGSTGKRIAVEKTRANLTDAYTAKDVVNENTSGGTVWTFSNVARVLAGSGYIVKATLFTNDTAAVVPFRLHLYHTAPAAVLQDNAPYTLLYADVAKRIGTIDFPTLAAEGSGGDSVSGQNDTVRLHFVCAAGTKDLIGVLECLTGYTPAGSTKYTLELSVDDN